MTPEQRTAPTRWMLRARQALLALGLASGMAALGGCVDDPSGATGPTTPGERGGTGPVPGVSPERGPTQRFNLSVRATGPFRPGAPIRLRVEVSANLATPAAEVRLVAPEVETARQTGWGASYHIQPGVSVAPLLRTTTSLSRNERFSAGAELSVPAAGYYRVLAVVTASGTRDLAPVENSAVRELWILVDEQGGRVTGSYAPELLPSGAAQRPGPFLRGGDASSADAFGAPRLNSYHYCHEWQCRVGWVGYFDPIRSKHEGIPGLQVGIEYYTGDPYAGRVHFDTEYSLPSNAEGYFEYNCKEGWSDAGVLLKASVYAGPGFTLTPPAQGTRSASYCSGFTAYNERIAFTDYETAHVYRNAQKYIPIAEQLFGTRPGTVEIAIEPWTALRNYPYYDKFRNQVNIMDRYAMGVEGLATQAHEYGHAFHHRAAGGLDEVYVSCPISGHDVNMVYNYRCAMLEGFAEFFSATVSRQLGRAEYWGGDPHWWIDQGYPTADGWRTEGAVAAFLYDLLDPDNGEVEDDVTLPGTYLVEIMRSCQYFQSGTWYRFRSARALAYCLENNSTDMHMGTDDGFGAVRFSTTTPLDAATRAAVRKLARWHLRGSTANTDGAPTNPTYPPDPGPEPACDPYATGTGKALVCPI